MDKLAKPKNRALFLVSVAVTGAFAGAAVWLFFFAMEHGIDYLWTEIPHMLGAASPELASGPFGFLPYPFFVCLLGGLLIGLYEKLTGTKTDDLNQVMAKVKQDGRYPYDKSGQAFARGIAAAAVWRKYWTGGRPDRRYRGSVQLGRRPHAPLWRRV